LLVHMLTLCAKPSRSEVALAMANWIENYSAFPCN
jgi:hypothetical protein